MLLGNPTFEDLHTAGKSGMDSRIDVETAEEIGIPSSPEKFLSDINASAALAEFSADAISARLGVEANRLAARTADHAAHVSNNHLSGVAEITSEQAAVNRAGQALAADLFTSIAIRKK